MAEIDDELGDWEALYAERLAMWQEQAIARIAEKVRLEGAGVLHSGLSLHGAIPDLRSDLLTVRERIAMFGREQVAAEMARQEV